jgi:hypothetical protein
MGTNFIVRPDAELVTSLSSEMRAKLYQELASFPQNHYMREPFTFAAESFESALKAGGVEEPVVSLIKRLSYPRGNRVCFSDLPHVAKQIPTEAARVSLAQALHGVSATLVRLHIRPTTDIDKLVGYWCAPPGVRLKDVRPLLESVQRLDEGGSISLVYLLPAFARQRLFTYPLNVSNGEAEVDCHWTTMNFFRDVPDSQFARPAYTRDFINSNYYAIARPSQYGDLIFLVDARGDAVHSCVYLADDIVFTKNGRTYGQPWLMMRLDAMISMYSFGQPKRILFYRSKGS